MTAGEIALAISAVLRNPLRKVYQRTLRRTRSSYQCFRRNACGAVVLSRVLRHGRDTVAPTSLIILSLRSEESVVPSSPARCSLRSKERVSHRPEDTSLPPALLRSSDPPTHLSPFRLLPLLPLPLHFRLPLPDQLQSLRLLLLLLE